MTCDDVLPSLELGDAPGQQLAHAHAQGCAACGAAVERWAAVKSSLAATPALTDRDRALWHNARSEPRPRRLPRAGLAGAAVVAGVGVALLWPRPLPQPDLPPAVQAESQSPAAPEFADLDRRLDELDGELAALERRVALADVRREAAELAAEYR